MNIIPFLLYYTQAWSRSLVRIDQLCPTVEHMKLLTLACLFDPDGLGEDGRPKARAALANAQRRFLRALKHYQVRINGKVGVDAGRALG